MPNDSKGITSNPFQSYVEDKKNELQTPTYHAWTVENMTAQNRSFHFYLSPSLMGMEGVFFSV